MQSSRRGLVRLLGLVRSVSGASCGASAAGSGSRGLGMGLGQSSSRRYFMSKSDGLDMPRDPHKQVC